MSFNIKVVPTKEAIKAFEKLGWIPSRTSGSHLVLTKPNSPNIILTLGQKEMAVGTLRTVLQRSCIPYRLFNKVMEQV